MEETMQYLIRMLPFVQLNRAPWKRFLNLFLSRWYRLSKQKYHSNCPASCPGQVPRPRRELHHGRLRGDGQDQVDPGGAPEAHGRPGPHQVPAGAQRPPAHRTRQGHQHQLRLRAGARRNHFPQVRNGSKKGPFVNGLKYYLTWVKNKKRPNPCFITPRLLRGRFQTVLMS